jgi:hypothetical protein
MKHYGFPIEEKRSRVHRVKFNTVCCGQTLADLWAKRSASWRMTIHFNAEPCMICHFGFLIDAALPPKNGSTSQPSIRFLAAIVNL